MPSTAVSVPPSERNSTRRSSTSSRAPSSPTTEDPGVEGVPERFAEEHERTNQEGQEQRREEEQVRMIEEASLGHADLEPPRDRREPQAHAQERQRGLSPDGRADAVGAVDEQGGDAVG